MKTVNYRKQLFIIVCFLFWCPQFMYVPIFSPYLDSLGASYSFIGMILGSYGLTQLLFRLPVGILSDFWNQRKSFLVFGMLISMVSCFILLITENTGWILLARALAGVAAATWVVFTVIYPSFYAKDKIHDAMGSISFIIVLGQFLGMIFSGYIVSEWGYKGPFIISSVASFIGLALSLFVSEPYHSRLKSRRKTNLGDLIKVIKNGRLLKISFISVIAHGIIFSTMFGFTSAYALSIGFSERELTLMVAVFMIPHAFAAIYYSKKAVLKFGEWKTLIVAFVVTALSLILLPITESKVLFLLFQCIGGFSLGFVFPILLGMSIEKIEEEKRATAMGTYQSVYALGILLFPYMTGWFNTNFGIKAGFYLLGAFSLAASYFTARWAKQEQQYEKVKAG